MRVLMHKNAMDVCIEVIKIQYRDLKRVKLKVRWWNLGYTGNPWVLDFKPSQLTISNDKWKDWVDITNKLDVIRTKPGLPE